jgi:hypothetical protein
VASKRWWPRSTEATSDQTTRLCVNASCFGRIPAARPTILHLRTTSTVAPLAVGGAFRRSQEHPPASSDSLGRRQTYWGGTPTDTA